MGRPTRALRYVALEGDVSAGCGAAMALGEGSDADFEAGVAEIGRMAGEGGGNPLGGADARARTRDGSKTAAKLETRMRRRAERLALDAVRHQEIMDNRELRQARSLSRRWFVLGRALDAAMTADADGASALRAAIDRFVTRPDERALLGWSLPDDFPGS